MLAHALHADGMTVPQHVGGYGSTLGCPRPSSPFPSAHSDCSAAQLMVVYHAAQPVAEDQILEYMWMDLEQRKTVASVPRPPPPPSLSRGYSLGTLRALSGYSEYSRHPYPVRRLRPPSPARAACARVGSMQS